MTLVEFAFAKKQVYEKHARNFQRVFGTRLSHYWDNLTGFNVVKFDEEFVHAPDGVSTHQAVKEQWGQEGVNLVLALLGK